MLLDERKQAIELAQAACLVCDGQNQHRWSVNDVEIESNAIKSEIKELIMAADNEMSRKKESANWASALFNNITISEMKVFRSLLSPQSIHTT